MAFYSYVWTFSTPTERYFPRRGRGKAVVDEVLSEEFSGVLVSDFYAAYHRYDGPKQSAAGGLCPPLFKPGAGSAAGHLSA